MSIKSFSVSQILMAFVVLTSPPLIGATSSTLIINLPNDVKMELIRIPAGSFVMGSPNNERSRAADEGPTHTVTLSRDFYMGKTEVTQQQWLAVKGSWPGTGPSTPYGLGDNYPAYWISWNDIAGPGGFIEKLNQHITSTSQVFAAFRLPSEAEFEYACRAGTSTRFFFGDSLGGDEYETDAPTGSDAFPGHRSDYMWYVYNCKGNANGAIGSKPVGTKLPNAWGLFDMSGNLWEWCQDWYGAYSAAPEIDPGGPLNGSWRVIGRGFWGNYSQNCRSASRYGYIPDARNYTGGFRLAWTPHLPVISAINNALIPDDQAYAGPTPVLVEGLPPITWSLIQGPSGMTISPTTGIVSWPLPTVTGSPFTIKIRATNAFGHGDTTCTLTVYHPGPPSTPQGGLEVTYHIKTPSISPDGQPVHYTYAWTSDNGDSVTHGPTALTSDTLTEMNLVQDGETWTVTVTPRSGINSGTPATAAVKFIDIHNGVMVWSFYR